MRSAGSADRFWQTAGVYMHFSIGARQPSGWMNVSVFVTIFAMAVVTGLLCQGTPIIVPEHARPPNRIGAPR